MIAMKSSYRRNWKYCYYDQIDFHELKFANVYWDYGEKIICKRAFTADTRQRTGNVLFEKILLLELMLIIW